MKCCQTVIDTNSFNLFTEAEPRHYLAYYKRGTVYLALGKAKQALLDFDKVLELKPDFSAVRIQRGNVHLKNGDLYEAEIDFAEVVSFIFYLFIEVLSK